ncbi:hypothetical protein FPV67DRAFT_1577176 [Lyophyllum atratum]|nr:hypothetical protein FPV67DRAFT_1577176 [Lyophyllum atratum]
MPTTRQQAVKGEAKAGDIPAKTTSIRRSEAAKEVEEEARKLDAEKEKKSAKKEDIGDKRAAEDVKTDVETKREEPPIKKAKRDVEDFAGEPTSGGKYTYQAGTIERGHIYFFYRPKVQQEGARDISEVKNFHMLLVPRPPEFATHTKPRSKINKEENENAAMRAVAPGADAVPAPEPVDQPKKHFRLVTIGKKHLPDPESGGKGRGRKETFWATVTAVGDNLHNLEEGLGEKTYETKTRGTRHEEPARLAARGAYAIVNNDASVPSKRETHFGYYISHPSEVGEVQEELGIGKASSFVMQVKNPLAPNTGEQRMTGKGADYPKEIMRDVFGEGGAKGRESYGLRFAPCHTPELLDYKGAQLLLIAARGGEEGLETSLGEGRGKALEEAEEKESKESIEQVFRELDRDASAYPAEPLEGQWI